MFNKKSNWFEIGPRINKLNVEIGDYRVERVGEKAGEPFGETGKKIGGVIDDLTDWLTIKIDL